ncbi:MAG: hypothetical protein CFE21_12925 [Bacteroidetes bacterium B1(2017)]|nr:MAG: hypothetical protein CFE21_12925 [Bacteroidetes bacterium B1(2017)]
MNVKLEADESWHQSTDEYIDLFNLSPIPMWIFEIETYRFLLVNEAACKQYGYTQEEFACLTLKDIRPIEELDLLDQLVKICSKNKSYQIPEMVKHKKKGGEQLLVKIKSSAVTFKGKEARLVLLQDVTEEAEIQNQLEKSNSRLKLASEIAKLGYWSHDLPLNKIQWSDELYKIFEVDPSTFKLNFEEIKELYHHEDQGSFNFDFENHFGEIEVKENESRIYTPKGELKWIYERQYLINNKENKPIRLDGIALDITKRKLHEQELVDSNERFKFIAQATTEAIIDWDVKNKTVFWGEGFTTIFGYDNKTTNIHLWQNNIHADDKEKVLVDLHTYLCNRNTKTFNSEFRFIKSNSQTAYVQLRGIIIRNANGTATRVLGAMIDLTETLERLNKIEKQSKVLQEISWTQSHIVRAPLANLMGLVSLLKENSNLDQEQENLLNLIDTSAQKLDTIIREIVKKSN